MRERKRGSWERKGMWKGWRDREEVEGGRRGGGGERERRKEGRGRKRGEEMGGDGY